jgi:copper(I)-binding protein
VKAEPITVRRLGIGLAVAAALLTSACAAGQQASTANQKPTLDGTNATVGSMALRGLVIEAPDRGVNYPVGSDAAIKLVLVNTGSKPDRLVSITTKAAADWGSFSTADAATVAAADTAPSTTSAVAPPTAAPGSASGTESGSATPSGSTGSSAPTPLPAPVRSVLIAPSSRVSWGTPESKNVLLLRKTTTELYPGTTVSVTFRFADAGSVTVDVPIALTPVANLSVIPEPSTSSVEG